MDLRSGLVISTLPRFSSGTLDGAKIEANSGVMVKGGALWPKGDWRPISGYEAGILDLAPKANGGKLKKHSSYTSDTLWIFDIPLHLMQHWQRISGQLALDSCAGPLFEDGQYRKFVSQVVEFFRFKGVSTPSKCKFEIVSIVSEISRTNEIPVAEGSDSSPAVELPLVLSEEVNVAVNLGATASSLIFVNLSFGQMESILGERSDTAQVSKSCSVERFFSCFPEYPCLRIALPPRAGYLLGRMAIVHARCPISGTYPDFWLCVSAARD